MGRSAIYNRASVSVTIDGETAKGIADGDSAIRILPNETGAAVDSGTDGYILSFSNNKTGAFEIDLFPTSSTLAQLISFYKAQKSENAKAFDITVATGVGEFHSLSGCGITNIGEVETGGEKGLKRTVKIVVGEIDLDEAT